MKRQSRHTRALRGLRYSAQGDLDKMREINKALHHENRELKMRLDATPETAQEREAPNDVMFAATDLVKEAFDLLCTALAIPTYGELEEQAVRQQEDESLGLTGPDTQEIEAMEAELADHRAMSQKSADRIQELAAKIKELEAQNGALWDRIHAIRSAAS